MTPLRQWISDQLAKAKKKAALNQMKRELDERLFLFAIEIGRGKRLLPDQRRLYARTFRTAQIMLLLDDDSTNGPPKVKPIQTIKMGPEEEWLLKEPVIKAELEDRLKRPLSDLEDPVLPDAERSVIVNYLHLVASVCPDILSHQEVESIVDKLDHPLDRA